MIIKGAKQDVYIKSEVDRLLNEKVDKRDLEVERLSEKDIDDIFNKEFKK